MSFRCLVVSLIVVVAAGSTQAEDWPQFRGARGDGHSPATGLPSEWNDTTNVAWKTEIPGKGWSSPSLYQGRLYLTSAVPVMEGSTSGDLSLRALCVDGQSGQILWNDEVFTQASATAPKIHSKNSHASPTAIVEKDRVYVHFGHMGTACLDLAGKILWKNDKLAYRPVHGNGGSPVLVDGVLIFSCDGAADPFVVGLDAATGEQRWKFLREADPAKRFAFSTPAVIEVAGQKQVVSPGAGVVNALDPATGREIWRVDYDNGYSVIPQPAFGHGLVFLSSGYDSPTIYAIRPDGQGDVTDTQVAWTLKKGAPHTPSPLVIGDELYLVADKGVATCVDARTGKEHWQERIGGNYSASPLFADGKIYIQSEEGAAFVLRPGKTFAKPAETGFPERTLASYAIGDSSLFIRTEKHLYRVQR
ncbi:MAG: PQQ-binding-like beta-propeller repeat protein [Pirellulaceae bacterium]|nr:PQQ-binding-like beta-propeller repeat protein [Pirellulaceae bacterium]